MSRRIAHLLIVVVLITSGTYLMVYLYRWEWNRALVSGVFFLTAEVALAGSMILRRMRDMEARIEHRLDQHERHQAAALGSNPAVLERLRETAPQPGSPFSWLEDTTQGRMGVFVPVLLGAGVVLSGLAYIVERLAGATAGAAMEKGLARRMGALALPAGGLLAAGAVPLDRIGADLRAWEKEPLRGRQILTRLALVALAGLGTMIAVDSLADATQNRPDPIAAGTVTTVDLQISHKANRSTADTAEALWFGCRGTLPRRIAATSIDVTGADTARLVLEPGVGRYAQRRFQGCLQDATFDLVQAKVTRFTTTEP